VVSFAANIAAAAFPLARYQLLSFPFFFPSPYKRDRPMFYVRACFYFILFPFITISRNKIYIRLSGSKSFSWRG